MNYVDTALKIAVEGHAGQTDRGGEAYILHPLTVGLKGKTDEERATGFLHDVLEDTHFTEDDLKKAGIPTSIIEALKLLTHDKSTPYFDYVQRIIDSNNPLALRVKFNDVTHNFERGKAYPDLQKKHGIALEMVSAAIAEQEKVSQYVSDPETQYAIFAGGCFWGVQHYFNKETGVKQTFAGFTGGVEEYPSYEDVRHHRTHHVEAVLVEYNPNQTDYETLCKLFFEIHDPAQTNGQGPDEGPQYRSCIFFRNEEQRSTTLRLMDELRKKGYEVNTLLLPATKFWIAEQLHQNYYERTNGEPYCHFRSHKF